MLQVTPRLAIPDSELEFQFVRSSGPGGQAVNKVSSKAQMRWNFASSTALPWEVRQRFREKFQSRLTTLGELVLSSGRNRDRLQNQQDCLDKLRDMILAVAEPPKLRKKTKPSFGSKQRSKAEKKRQGEKKKGRSGKAWD
jgi:ribosome-associated protein